MPTSSAASAARRETAAWAAIAQRWHADDNREIWDDVPGAERAVIPEVDPLSDLEKRAGKWGYPLQRGDLSDVALFAAALARTEAEAWASGDGVLATQAFEERRHLAGDRILPWAVPWLRAVARWFPETRSDAVGAVDALLEIGERHRTAPILTGAEGLFLPGHDGYGPNPSGGSLGERIESLWGGLVVFRRSLDAMAGQPQSRRQLAGDIVAVPAFRKAAAARYETAAVRWRHLADTHPGTARYWVDLAERADSTARIAK